MKISAKAWDRVAQRYSAQREHGEASRCFFRASRAYSRNADRWLWVAIGFGALSIACRLASLILRASDS